MVWHEKMGMSADKIVEQFPQLSHGDIYAALAYYWDHNEEMDAKIADDEAFEEEFRRKNPSRLKEKLEPLGLG